MGLAQSQPGTSPSSILQSSTFGGFWDLVKNPKIVSEKLHLSAQRFSDVPYCPVFWVVATRGCVLSVLDQVRTKFGPWNPEYGPKRDFGKVTSFRPTTFGRPVLSRILGCGNPGVCSKCPRPSSDQVRALEPGIRAKTGFWKSYIFSPNDFRTSRIVPYSGFQGPNLVRTGPELVRTGPELVRIGPAQVPTWSPVVSCLQSTLTTWLYIVKVAILDMPTHLIRARPKTGFGPKSR